MYYIKLSDNGGENSEYLNNLVYYCRQCNYEDKDLVVDKSLICVSKSYINKKQENYKDIVNEYTKLDPTLPEVKNIKCPNAECVSNKDGEDTKIVTIRYDDLDMKYMYLCCLCDNVWKNE
jgi:DNA-directed RNA polymerase subunit M/transcription elongation factor TFIIS|tara:strand:+ start:202 stop:561 length:360 start_codon:yes stop_codon:yes gene_type:complete